MGTVMSDSWKNGKPSPTPKKPRLLGQLCALILSLCRTLCNKSAELPGCYSFPIQDPRPPNPSFSVPPSVAMNFSAQALCS
uniref:Uncharacterized protein n=1 Tax=Mus spicilegus TaxID=10103 RepID=A0A8C6MWW5_MUSSI